MAYSPWLPPDDGRVYTGSPSASSGGESAKHQAHGRPGRGNVEGASNSLPLAITVPAQYTVFNAVA